VCAPCARRDRNGANAATLPSDVWDRVEVLQALKDRHFGRLILALRKACSPEMTQTEIGRVLQLTQGQVSRIERSSRPMSDLDKLDRWARVLRIPQRHMWFILSDHPSDEYDVTKAGPTLLASSDTAGDEVHRRQFLRTAGAGMVAIGASLLHGDPLHEAAASVETARPESAAEIREMTRAFRRLDNRYGGGHSRSVVTSYIGSILDPALKENRRTGAARNELFGAAAELHQLAGWMAYDVGHEDAGRRHLRKALRLCQEAGSDALEAEMLAGMSHHAAFYGAPDSARIHR
jgi:transcriptional regulator with XRE-family HTH domain